MANYCTCADIVVQYTYCADILELSDTIHGSLLMVRVDLSKLRTGMQLRVNDIVLWTWLVVCFHVAIGGLE